MPTDFIYPINSKAQFHIELADGSRLPITPDNLWAALEEEGPTADSFFLRFRIPRHGARRPSVDLFGGRAGHRRLGKSRSDLRRF